MSRENRSEAKTAVHLRGLKKYLQANEQPIMNIPGIWDNGEQDRSTACDIVLTNQRLLGYYLVSFPRERLFLDALQLSAVRAVTLRQKNFEPVFREIMVSSNQRRVYIRAPRRKIEALNTALRSAIEQTVPTATITFAANEVDLPVEQAPVYGRQEVRRPFEGSALSVSMLFTGGLFLEVLGILLWMGMHSAQAGVPLFIAGFVSWLAAILLRKKR